MDYLYTVQVLLLYFSNLKLTFYYAWTKITVSFFETHILQWNVAKYSFSSKSLRKVLIGVCNDSLIISDKIPCKMFPNIYCNS